MGLALATLLHRAGTAQITVSSRREKPPDHPLFGGDAPAVAYRSGLGFTGHPPDALILAVPDAAIAAVAQELARTPLPAGTAVLHLSGAVPVDALAPLARRGCWTGGIHPLASVPRLDSGDEPLLGATFGVEARGEALRLADAVVAAAGGRRVEITAHSRPLYHAAAVFAANYTVVLLQLCERLLAQAGVGGEAARRGMAALAAGAVLQAGERGAGAALTGPIARGDAGTVRLHLSRLSGPEREVYCLLGLFALEVAGSRGVDPARREEIRELLEKG